MKIVDRSLTGSRFPRGSALIAVVFMFTVIAGTVTAMGLLFATEMRRTRSAVAGAQLRQILLAAPPAAMEELRKNAAEHDAVVATPLQQVTLTLHVRPAGETVQVQAVAKSTTALASQTLTYGRAGGSGSDWKLQSAALGVQP